MGEVLGAITAGSMSVSDNFTSASRILRATGITTSTQEITAPDEARVVPGIDSKFGILYNHSWHDSFNLGIELGYRFAYYLNAISEVNPTTLVQPGTNATIPEFATGTMAINSTGAHYSPFTLNGPYLNVMFTFL